MMINKLTKAQGFRIGEFRDEWIQVGLSTEPADRPRAEQAIRTMYAAAGQTNLERIVWCGSPLSQGLTRALVLSKEFWASVRDSVGASVLDSVRASVLDSVRASVRASVRDSGYGQHDANWLAFYEFFKNACGLTGQTKRLSGHVEQAQSAGWYLPHEKICWVCERHNVLKRDERGRLHCLTGPSLQYPDGWGIYAVHGVRVPGEIIEKRESITPQRIESETNAEVRRVLIELYGFDHYLKDGGFTLEQQDDFGRLYRKRMSGEPDIVFVRVVNSTPEPDGSCREYVLPVRSTVRTAHEAVAMTFGMSAREYNPIAQS